ncbi:stearoyl-CoA desaturase 5-like [Styela clava]
MNILTSELSNQACQQESFIDFTFPSSKCETSDTIANQREKIKQEPATENSSEEVHQSEKAPQKKYVWKFILKNVILMSGLHIISIYAIFRLPHMKMFTILSAIVSHVLALLGVTAGAHRLWTHRAYKAKLPLRIFLMILDCLALQNSLFDWCRDHRTHHKYSETDADPHNACRGFFFSHMGWLLIRKHPDVAKKGRTIQIDDLMKDPVVRFQHRFYVPLAISICFVLPSVIPWYFGGETIWNAYCMAALRYCVSLHLAWCVNSVAHMYGNRPYDRSIHPVENLFLTWIVLGEGFHNYHHTFPHDYAASEYGMKLNLATIFIDFMALIGQAYDRRSMSKEVIEARKRRTGMYSDVQEIGW